MADKSVSVASMASALLGSSCCVVQLMLNAAGVGCAGFAVLNPLKPYFTSLTLILLSYSWRKCGWRSTWKSAAIAILLLLSPHIVSSITEQALPVTAKNLSGSQTYYHFQVHEIKCEACALKIKQTIEGAKIPGVVAVQVFQKEGRVTIKMDEQVSENSKVPIQIKQSIEALGYTVDT
jgi:copper chaperone CopZ